MRGRKSDRVFVAVTDIKIFLRRGDRSDPGKIERDNEKRNKSTPHAVCLTPPSLLLSLQMHSFT